MSDPPYRQLADVLNTLPNGFPSTDSGVEIRLLKKIFRPEDIDLFCDLKLIYETVEQISERTGRPLEGLEEKLKEMSLRGQIAGANLEGTYVFRMVPYVFGIYEFQLNRMDHEMVKLHEEYAPVYGKQFFANTPSLMQTMPIEEEISSSSEAMPYERVSNLLEKSQSFLLMECICKKEKGLDGDPCEKPTEVCMGFAPFPGLFDDYPRGRPITKEQAREILKKSEEAGLVHLSNNFQDGQFFICNCCGCCCGVLRSISEFNIPASKVINSAYYAVIDIDKCSLCGDCKELRCQVNAIEDTDDEFKVVKENCIGCGLCVTTCPEEAIQMLRKPESEINRPPADELDWYIERGKKRGVDFSKYI